MNEVHKLGCMLCEVEQARMALKRTRDILDSIYNSLKAETDDIHNSDEYQETLQKQLLGE
ncbi:MAG: hypothetical protein IJT36_09150 [Alphaproteobacteria bacterium]|nr:hypothetical protein [Alphaproteobacteria bacterium]